MGYQKPLFMAKIPSLLPIFGKDYLKNLGQIWTFTQHTIHRPMARQK